MLNPVLPSTHHHEDDVLSAKAAGMQRLVDGILGSLVDAGIPYCLLRNRQDIPTALLSWSDLDIMVLETASLDQLNEVFAHLEPAQIVHIRPGRLAYFFPMEDLFLRVDIFNGDVEWRSFPFVDHRAILAPRRAYNGVMVASPMHQAIVVWFSKLLWGSTFSSRYERLIEDAIRSQPDAFRSRLSDVFGDALAEELITLGLEGRLPESLALAPRCKQALFNKALRQNPFKAARSFASQMGNGLVQRVRPTGLKVVILGPDGAGKTTTCSSIIDAPSRNIPFGHIKYRLLYHRILPPLSVIESKLRRQPVNRSVNPHNPHANVPHSPLVWILKFGYYTVDQWLSEISWVRTQLAHTELILLDRHLLELSIDPRRYRYTGPAMFARFLGRLSPKPDLIFVLDADPEIVQSRKQDVTFEETIRQRQAYRDLAERMPQAHLIDTSRPVENVTTDIRKILANFTSTRTNRRYRLDAPSSATSKIYLSQPVPKEQISGVAQS